MATLKQLQAQKKRILDKRDEVIRKQKIEFEKIGLEKEIKILQRKPSTSRNIRLAQRTGRGFKVLAKKIGGAAIRQAKRIKEQQLRDAAKIRKIGKKSARQQEIIITRTITGKGKKRKVKITKTFKKLKTGQKLSKIKEGRGVDIFANLDF